MRILKKNNILILFLALTCLFSCSPIENDSRQGSAAIDNNSVVINGQDISKIFFENTTNKDLPQELFGVWMADRYLWNLYQDGTFLGLMFNEKTGSWITSGSWSVEGNQIIIDLNSYNKKTKTYSKRPLVYTFELKENELSVNLEEENLQFNFKQYQYFGK